jgi:hypothetical protein
MSFILGTILVDSSWKPLNCVIDGNLITEQWYLPATGTPTIDYYMIMPNVPKAEHNILISFQNEVSNEVIDFWFEIIDIMPVEDIGDMQYQIMYPQPEIVGDPTACLVGSFNRGAIQNGIAILGFE